MPTHVAAGDYGNLVHPVCVGKRPGDQGVAGFMVGRHLFFAGADHPALAFGTGDDSVHRFLELGHEYSFLVLARRQDSGLVDQVGEVCAAEAGSLLGQRFQCDFRGQWLAG